MNTKMNKKVNTESECSFFEMPTADDSVTEFSQEDEGYRI